MICLPGMGYPALQEMTGKEFWQWHKIAIDKFCEFKGVDPQDG